MKKLRLLLSTILAGWLLCMPVVASGGLDNSLEAECCKGESNSLVDINHHPSSFTEEDAKLIQEINNNPLLFKYLTNEVDSSTYTSVSENAPCAVSSDTAQIASDSDVVARLQIFAWDGSTGGSSGSSNNGGINLGHAFIVITNVSDHYIYAGNLPIKPDTGITIGTWSGIDEHQGLWYGLEGYHYHYYGDYSGSYSMAVMLSQSWLDKANEVIKNGDSWSIDNNCSSFATKVWNTVCSDKLSAGWPINTPAALKNSIASYGTSKYGIDAIIPVDYTTYYGNPPKESKNYEF